MFHSTGPLAVSDHICTFNATSKRLNSQTRIVCDNEKRRYIRLAPGAPDVPWTIHRS
jgi:hypothetical protein